VKYDVLRKGDHLSPVTQRAGGRPLPEDFERIFNENHALVYRAAYRITGNAEDAEDVLQTLFLRLLRRDVLPDMGWNPKAYMHRAAINIALDIVRQRNRSVAAGDIEERLAEESTLQERMPAFRIQDWLRHALGELNPRAAEIFILKHVEGYDNAEIAQILGTSRGTVAVLLFRARARLKKSIRRRLGENL
jgi:RNA polymerase sigma-70 factor (ECF subfamily)